MQHYFIFLLPYILGEDDFTASVFTDMQYIYDIDALCLHKYQQNETVLATTRHF